MTARSAVALAALAGRTARPALLRAPTCFSHANAAPSWLWRGLASAPASQEPEINAEPALAAAADKAAAPADASRRAAAGFPAPPSAGATPPLAPSEDAATQPPAAARDAAAHPAEDAAAPPPAASPDAWARAGIHPAVVERLLQAHPDAVGPTPSQRAFLLAAMRGKADVWFKDYMGRGKTFAVALAALSLGQKPHPKKGQSQVVVLVPTPHLAQQVSDLLTQLSPGGAVHTTLDTDDGPDWNARIILSTPQAFNKAKPPPLRSLTHVILDEPDTMLGPVPTRYANKAKHLLARHPINLHPPPVVGALNTLLGIRATRDGWIDFQGQRKDVHTIWASATMPKGVFRLAYGRGWISARCIDLNFTADATDKQMGTRQALEAIADRTGVGASDLPAVRPPEHYAFVVEPKMGYIAPLDLSAGPPPPDDGPSAAPAAATAASDTSQELPGTLIEALAFLHATAPPPPHTYALALPPAGTSVAKLSAALAELGLQVAPLVPEALAGGIPAPPADAGGAGPVLLSNRAAVTGLHLPALHTVYLLGGLDMAGLKPKQRAAGGAALRDTFYRVVAGRLGRAGAEAQVPNAPQRVISLVAAGGAEEQGLHDLFAGRLAGTGGPGPAKLSEWKGEL